MSRRSIVTASGFINSYVSLKTALKKHPEWITEALKNLTHEESDIIEIDNISEPGEEGVIYFNTTDKKYYTYNSTNGFEPIGNSGIEIISSNFEIHNVDGELPVVGSVISYDIEPNKLYDFGRVNIGIGLYPTKSSDTIAYEYICRFTASFSTGSTPGDITVDSFNLIVDGVEFPDNTIEIEDGHTYELNILHGVAMLADITSTPANNG